MGRQGQGLVLAMLLALVSVESVAGEGAFAPGARSLPEAHNCYPYGAFWADRIEHALRQTPPIALEFDMRWHPHPDGAGGRLIVAHDPPPDGFMPPTFRDYGLESLRPHVEAALAAGNQGDWPLYTLNLNDLRGNEPEMYAELWALAEAYEAWLCTAIKGEDEKPAPMTVGPVLLLTGGGSQETATFYDQVPVGGVLRIFGRGNPDEDATNFRRWINYSWGAVEPGGPPRAGDWNDEARERLEALVKNAHARGYWIRFFSLNGHDALSVVQHGWSPGYNFGSLERAKVRWRAAFEAGVDFVATDQIAEAAQFWDSLRAEIKDSPPAAERKEVGDE